MEWSEASMDASDDFSNGLKAVLMYKFRKESWAYDYKITKYWWGM